MREILFRGKSLYYGHFVEGWVGPFTNGGYEGKSNRMCIRNGMYAANIHEVDPQTIGQYTGLTDKNGTKIFDGDIVKYHYYFDDMDTTTFDLISKENTITARITIGNFGIYFENNGLIGYLLEYLDPYGKEGDIEVIGNIYDNPELLEANNG